MSSHCQTNSIYSLPFKRNSSNFGSRLWSDLPLPIDECFDNDIDFNHLPELRRKPSGIDSGFRTISLQPNQTLKVTKPLARNISSPMRFNYTAKADRTSDTSFSSKVSFRKFLRRMSSKRRNTCELSALEAHREKRKSARISIR